MRVTANTFPNSLLDQLGSLSQRQNKLQNQAATGQRVQLPEDDPVTMRRVLDMQAEGKSVGQYQRNIGRHEELATASFNSIKSLKKISDRAREISILADGLRAQGDAAGDFTFGQRRVSQVGHAGDVVVRVSGKIKRLLVARRSGKDVVAPVLGVGRLHGGLDQLGHFPGIDGEFLR